MSMIETSLKHVSGIKSRDALGKILRTKGPILTQVPSSKNMSGLSQKTFFWHFLTETLKIGPQKT